MGVKKFEIVLDSPIYYAGQTITGKLMVDVSEPVKVRGIRLNYIGKAKVRWSEGSGKSRTVYARDEKYLDLQQLVSGDYQKESQLAMGQYVFIFNCQLPKNSPSSYEGDFGRIKYSVKATMDIPWKRDPTAKQSLTVLSILDLNHLPVAAAPVMEQCSKTFWGQSNQMTMSFQVPVRGYVCGQMMTITVHLNNMTDIEVKKISAELQQNVMFHANTKSRPWKQTITRSEYPVTDPAACKQGVLRIKVPALPPSYLEFCNIIDLRYHLTVAAEVSGLHTNLEASTEILIGNVPLIAYQKATVNEQVLPSAPVDSANPSQGQSSNPQSPPYNVVSPLLTTYTDLLPPTYEQSLKPAATRDPHPSSDSDSDAEPHRFASLYPVYKLDTLKE